MREFTDVGSLLDATSRRVTGHRASVLAIEGHSTAGKSTLAGELAKRFGTEAIHTDDFAWSESEAPTYLERMNLDRLGAEIMIKKGEAPVIIEGICLRDVLREIAIAPTLFIYVKRITAAGLWADDLENYLHDGKAASWLSWTDRQSVEYHLRESPQARADFMYSRVED